MFTSECMHFIACKILSHIGACKGIFHVIKVHEHKRCFACRGKCHLLVFSSRRVPNNQGPNYPSLALAPFLSWTIAQGWCELPPRGDIHSPLILDWQNKFKQSQKTYQVNSFINLVHYIFFAMWWGLCDHGNRFLIWNKKKRTQTLSRKCRVDFFVLIIQAANTETSKGSSKRIPRLERIVLHVHQPFHRAPARADWFSRVFCP